MKKRYLILVLAIVILIGLLISEKPREIIAQSYETLSLRFVQQKETDWITIDNANGYTTFNVPIVDTRLKGASWGSFCLFVRADTIKAGSAQDSLQIWFKELQADTTTVSSFDSTSIGIFNWNTGDYKKYTIVPDVSFGFKFSFKHFTTVDDSIKVKLRLIYQ